LKALFDYFDKDQSGALDMEELEQLIYMLMG
jgi:Ca2+-binding EF-hand superfamily protein